jgi:hypothetical protein
VTKSKNCVDNATSVNDDLADEIRHLAVELAEYWADGEPACEVVRRGSRSYDPLPEGQHEGMFR